MQVLPSLVSWGYAGKAPTSIKVKDKELNLETAANNTI